MAMVISNTPRNGFPKALGKFYDHLDGTMCKSVISFTDEAFALTDAAGVVAYAGKKVFDFPAGVILIHGALANLAVTKSSAGVNDTFDGDFSVGTVTASNNATLTGTEADVIPSTATPQAVSGATTAKGFNSADIAPLDGTATAQDLFLNFVVDDADHDVTTTPANLVVNGTLTIVWTNLGDY
jgi:hypothetical protein